MQGSYILLAALAIFILIGGAKRVLRSFRLTSVFAVIIIISIIIGNLFQPIGKNIQTYIGTLILLIFSLYFLFTQKFKLILFSFLAITVITSILLIYRIQIIEKFNVTDTAASFMIIAGTAISSFILSRNSGQAFIQSVISIVIYDIITSVIYTHRIVIGNDFIFDLIIYSSFGSILLNELISEISSLFGARTPDLTFEAGTIEEDDETNKK